MAGSFVGELFGNILGDGFSRLVKGDRFYFESSQSGLTAGKSATHPTICQTILEVVCSYSQSIAYTTIISL